MHHRTLVSLMAPGTSGYIATHGAHVRGDRLYVNGDFAVDRMQHGTFELRLIKFPSGKLVVDISACTQNPFSHIAHSLTDNWVHVDAVMRSPVAVPNRTRLCDLPAGKFGFVNVGSAWVFGQHMWLDGLADVSVDATDSNLLFVERRHDNSYVVDLRYCAHHQFGNDWRGGENVDDGSIWPIQVLELVQSRRLSQAA